MVYLKLNSEGIDHYLTYWSKLKVKIKIVHFIWIIGLIFVLPSFAQAHSLKNEEVWSKVYLTKEQALSFFYSSYL